MQFLCEKVKYYNIMFCGRLNKRCFIICRIFAVICQNILLRQIEISLKALGQRTHKIFLRLIFYCLVSAQIER